MTKAEIIAEISSKTGIDRITAGYVLEAFFDSTKEAVKNGDSVSFRGFGTFLRKTRAKKVGRNIRAGKAIVIPEHFIPAFKVAKSFAEEVKQSK